MNQFEVTTLTGRSFDAVFGRVVVEDRRIEAIGRAGTDSTDIVLPAFVNAHTHVRDSVAKEAAVGLSLTEAVAPPDSLKHRRLAAADRANLVLGVGRPPIRALLDHTTVALGTDNVMLNAPLMFQEMAYTAKSVDVTAREVLRMATTAGADAVGLDCGVIEPGKQAALVVIDGGSDNLVGTDDPVRAVVRRATALDIKEVVL